MKQMSLKGETMSLTLISFENAIPNRLYKDFFACRSDKCLADV